MKPTSLSVIYGTSKLVPFTKSFGSACIRLRARDSMVRLRMRIPCAFCAHHNSPSGVSDLHLIDVTPAPVLARFVRLHDGMLSVMEVLGGVFVRRAIATADVTADETHAQVDPPGADFQALFAAVGRRGDVANLGNMITVHSENLGRV